MHYRSKKTPEFLNQCSDFHPRQHFFGLARGFFVGLSVTLPHEMTKDSRKMKEI